ncbi:MAG: hypothetical protein ACRDTM_16355, partial [Micromonosporaceae bacterium]
MSGEVIRLNDHAKRADLGKPTDPTARIAPRGSRARRPRQPVIPRPEQLANGELHAPPRARRREGPLRAVDATSAPVATGNEPDEWDRRIASLLAFLRRRITGEYQVDEFGFDPDLTDNVLVPLLRLVYRHWFRVEVSGVEN